MKWILLVLVSLLLFNQNSYAFSADYAPPVEKRKDKVKKRSKRIKKIRIHRIKKTAKDMKMSTLLVVLAWIFIAPGAILGIYGAIASIPSFYILGLVFLIIGLILAIVSMVVSSAEKKKNEDNRKDAVGQSNIDKG